MKASSVAPNSDRAQASQFLLIEGAVLPEAVGDNIDIVPPAS